MAKQKPVDVDLVRASAIGRWLELLQVVGSIPIDILDGRHHPCPKCGGKDRFRLVDREAGAVMCNQCFREKNGDGFAAIGWMQGLEFIPSVQAVAQHLGVDCGQIKGSRRRTLAEEQLKFRPWNDALAAMWCLKKKPVTVEALKAVGARIAKYLGQYVVICIPVRGQSLDGDPVGWVLYNSSGKALPVYENKEIVDWVSIKTLAGSRAGLMGHIGGKMTIKTEGPSDMLALLSTSSALSETVVCNVHGCGENPRNTPWLGEFFKDRDVITVGDLDQPGQEGAISWARYAAVTAESSRLVQLPGPIAASHGMDLRDFLVDNGREAFDELINKAIAVEPDDGTHAVEDVDDPYRLARINLQRYATRNDGRTIRYWNSSWWVWKNCRYREMPETELKAKVTAAVKEEFDRLNLEEQKRYYQRKEDGELGEKERLPTARKVTPQLIGAVVNATRGMSFLSGECSLDTWVTDRQPRNYISLRNGLLDVDALLSHETDEKKVLLPHSPEWFSTVYMPYDFDPTAQCPTWESFLEHNLSGDTDRINVLQEWCGYLLLPDTGEQKFLILEGEGSNGKSVFCAGVEAILGHQNCAHVQLELFGDRFSKTMTLGKLVNICGDVGEIDNVAEGTIKALTAGNMMMFDRKSSAGIEAVPTARLMIACNNLPRFRDRSQGIWRRAMISPWKVQIAEDDKVKNMDKSKWWAETGELPGMFRWAMLGLARLREQGKFSYSEVMDSAKKEYQLDSNPAKQFLLDMFEPSEDSPPVKSPWIYARYRQWAIEGGYHPLSDRQFGKEVVRVFPKAKKSRKGSGTNRSYCYDGITFVDGVVSAEEETSAYWSKDLF